VKVKLLLAVLLLTGCATDGSQRSQWDYMRPENVKCTTTQIKICRQFGTHLICECKKKRDFRAYV
jgi:outer membrane biogenesis lipoprotein LolB